jgi:hypothetical protein
MGDDDDISFHLTQALEEVMNEDGSFCFEGECSGDDVKTVIEVSDCSEVRNSVLRMLGKVNPDSEVLLKMHPSCLSHRLALLCARHWLSTCFWIRQQRNDLQTHD